MDIYELLKDLTQCVGAAGVEKGVGKVISDYLEPYADTKMDMMNNLYCTFGEGYHILLEAHSDEVGFMITDITEDGFLKFDCCGTIDPRLLPNHEVSIWGRSEVKGVICAKPPHLQNDDDKKTVKVADLSIDTCIPTEKLKTLVRTGDRATLKRNYTKLLGDRISASSLDDRSGVAALILAADRLSKMNCKISMLFSAQEEVGCRGAKAGVFGIEPDEAISVDVSFAMSPGCKEQDCGELSKGAMIGFSPILSRDISKKLVTVAQKNSIPYQIEIMPSRTGTNADVISVNESGIKTGLISIPLRYMHEAVEVVDVNDVQAVADLIVKYVEERIGETNV